LVVHAQELAEETRRLFKHTPREWQLEAALNILTGNDVAVVAGTGMGKSLVFAILATAICLAKFRGMVIVISPLKALQFDQVSTLAFFESVLRVDLQRS
jgi:ATP-dependent helicase YprA (DUF1998 family)